MKSLRIVALVLLVSGGVFAQDAASQRDGATQEAARLLERGDLKGAESALTALLGGDPRNARAHELLGDVYRRQGRNQVAEKEYRLALEQGANTGELWKSLATVQERDRRFAAARESYRRALELSPADREARDGLDSLRHKRGLTLFGAAGGWDVDSTTSGWESELFFGGLDRFDVFAGASFADKFFYTRRSASGRIYAYYSATGYVKLGGGQKRYEYPEAINPVPDANAYGKVPSVEVEIADNLSSRVRASLAYEYFQPDFFFAPDTTAQNHKVSAELDVTTPWTPLSVRLLGAFLRDPDPDRTIVDRTAHTVAVVYGTQFLAGGGLVLDHPRLSARVLVLPNRDLDRSTDISVLASLTVPLGSFSIGAGYVYDHYASTSIFAGQTAEVATGTLSYSGAWVDLSAGAKTVRRPVRNSTGVFATARLKVPLP